METYDARKPSKRLTTKVAEYVSNEGQRREAAKTAKELEEIREVLRDKILRYVDQGYAPTSDSKYGVAVVQQSSRVAYEGLYHALVKSLGKRYPQYAEKIHEAATNLERKAQKELELKRVVVCDQNSELEKLVKRAEKAELEDRKTSKEIELVLYA